MNVEAKREGFVESPKREGDDQRLVPRQPAASGNGGGQSFVPLPEPEPEIDTTPPPAPVEVWPVTVKLMHKPIRNNRNELIHELVFREPTGGDINRYGNPVRIASDGEIVIDEQKMTRVIAALSGVLLPLLEVMDPRDWNSCAYRLRSFFLPEVQAW